MNRRAAIAMSDAEVAAFLDAGRVITVAHGRSFSNR